MAESRKYQVCFGVRCAPANADHTRAIFQKILGTARAPRVQKGLKVGGVRSLPQLGEKRAELPRFVFELAQGRAPIVVEGRVAEIWWRLIEPTVRTLPLISPGTGTVRPEGSTKKAAAE